MNMCWKAEDGRKIRRSLAPTLPSLGTSDSSYASLHWGSLRSARVSPPFLLSSEPLKVGKEKSLIHVRAMPLSDAECVLLSHPPLWLVKWAEGQRQSGNWGLDTGVSVTWGLDIGASVTWEAKLSEVWDWMHIKVVFFFNFQSTILEEDWILFPFSPQKMISQSCSHMKTWQKWT